MKVLQLQNNQYLIFMNDRVIFQSYQTIIAYYDNWRIYTILFNIYNMYSIICNDRED